MTLDSAYKASNTLFYFKQVVTQPARLAGTALLVKRPWIRGVATPSLDL